MATLKVSDLKKELKELDQKELIQIITELYKNSKEVKVYLSTMFLGEEAVNDLYEKTKKAIEDEFFPDRGFGKLRLAEAKKAITTFKKITNDEIKTIDLMIFYVELGTEYTVTYGDISERFYTSMESMYEKVLTSCNEEMFTFFNDRLVGILEASNGIGWGYHDSLEDIYYINAPDIEED